MKYPGRIRIGLASLNSRRVSVGLTVVGIAMSVAMILGVDRIRVETRENFTQTVAGTDLIVGARTSPVQLLLYSVFRIGDATANLSYESFEKISRHPAIAWAVPISLGDSHRGYRVVGTTTEYFDHIRYGRDQSLTFGSGEAFHARFEAVLGSEVARALDYEVGVQMVIAHGTRDDGLSGHESLPFRVSGVLTPTGTPVDRAVHIRLDAVEAIHVGWESGVRIPDAELDADHAEHAELHPGAISAFFLGLERRSDALVLQRAINVFPDEPLSAILPGVALNSLWGLFGGFEVGLLVVAAMTVATGLIGMIVGLSTTLSERRREMAVLRSVGARPLDIFSLFVMESILIGVAGALAGYLLLNGALLIANPILAAELGIRFSVGMPAVRELALLLLVTGLAFVTGALPAWQAYRISLHDGLDPSG
jgi:putative ABC transport system permease protein